LHAVGFYPKLSAPQPPVGSRGGIGIGFFGSEYLQAAVYIIEDAVAANKSAIETVPVVADTWGAGVEEDGSIILPVRLLQTWFFTGRRTLAPAGTARSITVSTCST